MPDADRRVGRKCCCATGANTKRFGNNLWQGNRCQTSEMVIVARVFIIWKNRMISIKILTTSVKLIHNYCCFV